MAPQSVPIPHKLAERKVMLISVVLPIYNGLPYLRESLATILAQSGQLELIVSDDGSSDGSMSVVKEISDRRVVVINNTSNLGIFGNLNRCIAAAKGEFIQVFSQDDLMKPGFLTSQAKLLRRYPSAGLAYGTPDYIDAVGAAIASNFRDETPEFISQALYLWISSHYGALPPSISSIMIPRRTFDAVGMFNPAYRMAGDLEFYNRVAEQFPMLRNRDVLHSIRSHEGQAQKLSSAGPSYMDEEVALEDWYRSRWSPADYRKVQRYRAASRGRYHLGWIRRLVLQGRIKQSVIALQQLNQLYPLHWVLSARVAVGRQPMPTLPPPCATDKRINSDI
jgi:glycosyltransferase involved in cell wall biosynthesis